VQLGRRESDLTAKSIQLNIESASAAEGVVAINPRHAHCVDMLPVVNDGTHVREERDVARET